MRALMGLSALALAVLASTRTASAEDLLESPRERQGYYLALGAHSAISYSREEGEGLGPMAGFATTLRLGQLLTDKIGLGLAIDVGGASGDDQSATLFGLGLAGQYELARNFAAHASVGLGVVSLSSPEDDDDEVRGAVGAAYTVGLTYDWFPWGRRSGGWAVTPGLQLRAVPSEEVDAFAIYFGVEVSYWSGLPRNQLELPASEAYGKAK
jgi:hypothetical protein